MMSMKRAKLEKAHSNESVSDDVVCSSIVGSSTRSNKADRVKVWFWKENLLGGPSCLAEPLPSDHGGSKNRLSEEDWLAALHL
eukprot:g16629.t1